jgi:hypothetical protein
MDCHLVVPDQPLKIQRRLRFVEGSESEASFAAQACRHTVAGDSCGVLTFLYRLLDTWSHPFNAFAGLFSWFTVSLSRSEHPFTML